MGAGLDTMLADLILSKGFSGKNFKFVEVDVQNVIEYKAKILKIFFKSEKINNDSNDSNDEKIDSSNCLKKLN